MENRRSGETDAIRAGIWSVNANPRPPNSRKPTDLQRSEVERAQSGIAATGDFPPATVRHNVECSDANQGSRKLNLDKGKLPMVDCDNLEAIFGRDSKFVAVSVPTSSIFARPSFQNEFKEVSREQHCGETSYASAGNKQDFPGYDKEFPSLPKKVQFAAPGKQFVAPILIDLPGDKGDNNGGNVWNKRMSFAMATKEKFVPPKFPGIAFKPPEIKEGKQIVRFTSEEVSRVAVPLKCCLVGKFTNGRPPPMEILQEMKRAIQFKEEIFPATLDQRHVFIRFQSREDFIKAYVKEVWWFGNRRMRIFKWTPGFAPGLESSIMPVWIGLNGVRSHVLDHGMIQSLVAPVGTFLYSHPNVQQFSRMS